MSDSLNKTLPSICEIVRPNQDLLRASRPLESLVDDEYFRALHQHFALKSEDRIAVPFHIEYAIDKAVRMRLKEGQFGLDFSQLISLQMEIQDSFLKGTNVFKPDEIREQQKEKIGEMLLERLQGAEGGFSGPLTYEEWKKRKTTEERLKRKLMFYALRDEIQQEEILSKERASYEDIKREKIKEWNKRKRQEYKAKSKERMKFEIQQKQLQLEKREQSYNEYKNWLLKNFRKYKQQKRTEKLMKRNSVQERKIKEVEKQQQKQKAEKAFQDWLRKKSNKRQALSARPPVNFTYRGLPSYSLNARLNQLNSSLGVNIYQIQ